MLIGLASRGYDRKAVTVLPYLARLAPIPANLSQIESAVVCEIPCIPINGVDKQVIHFVRSHLAIKLTNAVNMCMPVATRAASKTSDCVEG